MKLLRIAAASLVAAACCSGCCSYRIVTSLEPTHDAVTLPSDVRLIIASVRQVTPTNVFPGGLPPFSTLTISDADLCRKLQKRAQELYPNVFSDAHDAIPLNVTITRTAYTNMIGGGACISCLTLTVLPVRSSDKTDFEIVVTATNMAANAALSRAVGFSRSDLNWMSILPSGWIPVPGGEGKRAWGMDSATQLSGRLTLDSCAEAVVEAVRRVGPEQWKTPATK